MSLFLSKEEVAELTGKVRYTAQVRVLNDLHIPHILNAANRPIVARAMVERILGVVPNATRQPETTRWKSAKTA